MLTGFSCGHSPVPFIFSRGRKGNGPFHNLKPNTGGGRRSETSCWPLNTTPSIIASTATPPISFASLPTTNGPWSWGTSCETPHSTRLLAARTPLSLCLIKMGAFASVSGASLNGMRLQDWSFPSRWPQAWAC